MVEATYRAYQSQNSVPPPIPYKKPRPSSMMSFTAPTQQQQQFQQHQLQLQQHQQQAAAQQYAPPPYSNNNNNNNNNNNYDHTYSTVSDRLHPNFNHRRDTSASSAGSFATYQLQRDLPAINTQAANSYAYSHGHPTPNSRPIATPNTAGSSAHSQLQDAYVATLRRQKATVWCERAQAEDPRMLAAQRAAKQRAGMEIGIPSPRSQADSHSAGGSSSGSPASSLYGGTSGHHHHKANKILAAAGVVGVNTVKKKTWVKVPSSGSHSATGHFGSSSSKRIVMDPGSLIVGAVPTRLSATEVMGDSSDEDGDYSPGGSGRRRAGRTINSNHRQSQREYERNNRRSVDHRDGVGLRHIPSTGSKSSQNSHSSSSYSKFTDATTLNAPSSSGEQTLLAGEMVMSGRVDGPLRLEDYFHTNTNNNNVSSNPEPSLSRSSSLDGLGPLPTAKPKSPTALTASDLRRMGSVDEKDARTRTMSGVRLFVANPDAE
ncbi:hypothetical protein DFH27DRAFT_601380 [Peziza echinospora]|nr:hypothetical protein DFH27DRAFT_601380 [Peziza echinospora]